VGYDDDEKFSNEELLEYHNLGYSDFHTIKQAEADEANWIEQEVSGNSPVTPAPDPFEADRWCVGNEKYRVRLVNKTREILAQLSNCESGSRTSEFLSKLFKLNDRLKCTFYGRRHSKDLRAYTTNTGCGFAFVCDSCARMLGEGRLKHVSTGSPLIAAWATRIDRAMKLETIYKFECRGCGEEFERDNLPALTVVNRAGLLCRKCSQRSSERRRSEPDAIGLRESSPDSSKTIELVHPDGEVERLARERGYAIRYGPGESTTTLQTVIGPESPALIEG
jgi:hypothetical protein